MQKEHRNKFVICNQTLDSSDCTENVIGFINLLYVELVCEQ